ncbi:MAG TPA: hypothetical protein VNO14_12165 [Blastocatellia bacterium]|nr:hypothetical protein [Blastocatellia bacterium]
MTRTYLKVAILALGLALGAAPAEGQKRKRASNEPRDELAEKVKDTRAELIDKAEEYKRSLENVLSSIEPELKVAADRVAKLKSLHAEGLASRVELEKEEKELSELQMKAEDARKQMGEADNLIAEVKAAEQLDKLAPARAGAYTATSALIRFNGQAGWAISDVVKVEGFFASRFGRALPVSALGQTAVHDRLGFDHRNSIDVAVHPDSVEGQAVMAYLRSAGIPFIAFRSAVAGAATGAHIHIGYPSRRIAR